MMVEAGGTEKACDYYEAGAPKVDRRGHRRRASRRRKPWIKESIALQRELVAAGRRPRARSPYVHADARLRRRRVRRASAEVAATRLAEAITIADKAERNAATDAATAEVARRSCAAPRRRVRRPREGDQGGRPQSLTKKLVRKRIVDEGLRIDGRGPTDLRPLSAEVGVLPTAHGSGLFQRGETQVLNVTHAGMPRMNQLLDTLAPDDQQALHAPLQHAAVGQR